MALGQNVGQYDYSVIKTRPRFYISDFQITFFPRRLALELPRDVQGVDLNKSVVSYSKHDGTKTEDTNERIRPTNEMAEFKEMLKKLFEVRIKARKILIANFNKCIQLNENYPLIPWAKKYTLDQKQLEETAMRKEIRILGYDVQIETVDSLETKQAALEKKECELKFVNRPKGKDQNTESYLKELFNNMFLKE